MKDFIKILLIFSAYFITGKLGLQLAFVHDSATVIWAPTGVALASFLLFGYRIWPAIFLAAFLVNFTTTGDLATSIGIGIGNTLEGLIGAYLVNTFANGKNAFLKAQDIFKYILVTALVSTTISPNIGITSLILGGFAEWADFPSVWFTWWMGDVAGALIIAPFILFWMARHKLYSLQHYRLEGLLAFLVLILISLILFGGTTKNFPLAFISIPPIVWIAYRFGRRETISAIIILGGFGLWGTLTGNGPFARPALNESLIFLQAFMDVMTVTALALAVAVAERREIQEKLAQEKAEAQALLESIGDGILATDPDGKIILVNSTFEELTGWKKSEAIGKRSSDVIGMRDEKGRVLDEKHRPLFLALTTSKKVTVTNYLIRKNKTEFPARITASPILLDNKVLGVVKIFHDITREKELDEAKDEFISLASHELRTPMTAIKGLISMILEGDYGPINVGLKKPLNNIHESSDRQIHLINDLLDVSRLQTGKINYNITEFAINQVLKEEILSLQPIAVKQKIKLTFKEDEDREVQGDVQWVKQVLNNLIGNALKYTEKGTISISKRQDHDHVIVAVADTGIGIDPADQDKLFGRFRQLESNTAAKSIGSGLGLYISKSVARKMGGDIILEKSEKGRGSTFVFSIPKTGTAFAKKIKSAIFDDSQIANNAKKS